MERKLKICKRCNRQRLIWARGMCYTCDAKTKQENGTFKSIKKVPLKTIYKPTGQKILFETLISIRKHISFVSELKIAPINHGNCCHVLAKGQNKYPKFKLYDKNIVFLTIKEHHLFDNGTEEQRKQYARDLWELNKIVVNWEKLYQLRDELLFEYSELK